MALTVSGGYYTLYARATPDANTGGNGSGTYYAFEMQNPTFDQTGACAATFVLSERVGGAVTVLYTFTHSCRNNMVMRLMVRPGILKIWADQPLGYIVWNSDISSGQPGIGAHLTPSGNAVAGVQLGPLDRIAPATPNPTSVGLSAFPNRIEMQWKGSADNTNGIGGVTYSISQNGSPVGQSQTPDFVDGTVSPGTSYTYTISAVDDHTNASSPMTFTTAAAPSNTLEPRRIGVQPNASYWGAAGEQIDLVSGNLNFSVPLIKAPSRGGWSASFALSYNSQSWRQDSGGTWKLGRDVGYGFGWKLQAGSVTPYYSGYYTLDHYVFTDSTGAEYRMDQNSNGVWTSRQGFYGSLDTNASPPQLHFPDGSFWVLGVESSGNEEDAGTFYPSVIEDSNGNYILVDYAAGLGVGLAESSARISDIIDTRGVPIMTGSFEGWVMEGIHLTPPAPNHTYTFQYNSDAIPHLTGITSQVNTPESYTLSYAATSLVDPFAGQSFGAESMLQSIGNTGMGISHAFQYSLGTGEITQLTTPLGGVLQWQYRTYSYSGGRNYREVLTRYMSPLSGGTTYQWNLMLDNSPSLHATATMADVGAGTQKVWTFSTTLPYAGLATSYEEHDNTNTALLHKDYSWGLDAIGNVFVSSVLTTLNPGASNAVQTATVQTPDPNGYGNIIQRQVFDYGNLSTPARTYNYTYVTDPNYTSRYIRNRLLSASVTSSSGNLTLATNCYDATSGCGTSLSTDTNSNWQWYLPQYYPAAQTLLHDVANYWTGFTYRGNLTKSVALSGTTRFYYDIGGVPIKAVNGAGQTVSVTPDSTSSSLPTSLAPNGNGSLATSVSYAASWAVASVTGPNGAPGVTTYDSYGRPATTTSPDGLVTNYTYTYYPSANTQTATINQPAPLSGTRWKRTTLDGFGRTIRLETGHDGVTVSTVDTQYAPCACSPLGKVSAVSQPYAPGATPVWTTYTYDGSGRTLSVTLPDGASVTRYSYQGNQTTVTDPAGKWKTSSTDAMGNLLAVTEPDPNGGSNLATNYTYNAADQLTQVSMPRSSGTQIRTFAWSGTDLVSATNPENGTVTYTYDQAHHVLTRTDAKGQRANYSYDSYGRLTQSPTASYGYDTPLDSTFVDPGSRLPNTSGRLAWTQVNSALTTTFTYQYSYNPAGRVTGQRLQYAPAGWQSAGGTPLNLDAYYTWDNEGKMTAMEYPGKFSNGDNQPAYTYSYDPMGHLNGMTENFCTAAAGDTWPSCLSYNSNQVASASYSPAGQMTSLTYDSYNETRTYNSLLQMTRMTVPGVMDMQYQYSPTQNNGRITQSTDGILGETVNYTYDALNRLIGATATNGAWGSSYTYDGFGNLTGKTPTAGSAPYFSALIDPTTNRQFGQQYDANGNPAVSGAFTYDIENRLLPAQAPFSTYTYDHAGKRVFAAPVTPSTIGSTPCEIYFYGITGQRLATFSCTWSWSWISGSNQQYVAPSFFTYQVKSWNVYFGGKLMRSAGKTIVTDRLGSVRANSGGERMQYFPYGEERTSTPDGREKWATYFRDGLGQDYADQRYYSPLSGSFWTVDPGGLATASSSEPTSWNRFAYVNGDPINHYDPRGQFACDPDDPECAAECGPPILAIFGRFGMRTLSENPACDDPQGPGPGPPPPPPLHCSFNGANIGPAQFANTLAGFGYYIPVVFNFTATGGIGGYTWSNTQTVLRAGWVQFTNGSVESLYDAHLESLRYGNSGQSTTWNFPTAPVFDAPGLAWATAGKGITLDAQAAWSFNLYTSVSSGLQTALCPTVSWGATETWWSIHIPFSPLQIPIPSGQAAVYTRPTP